MLNAGVFLLKLLDFVARNIYTCIKLLKKVIYIADKSRAEYFKERRKNTKAFYVEIEKEKMEAFEKKLSDTNRTKKEWLNERIDCELNK